MDSPAQMISPDAYPQMVSRAQAAQLSQRLRSGETAATAAAILKQAAAPLREAVLTYVADLEAAGPDLGRISARAHEIKGVADTAGLPAVARIAEGLCHYLEQSGVAGAPADAAVMALHVRAIGRAARDGSVPDAVSQKVVRELAMLAAHKLAAARESGTIR